MSDPSRRGRRPAGQSTRGAVLEAARAEFDERGYEAVSLRGVARRAGVDPGTVRHWFAGKTELLAATLGLTDIDPSAVTRSAADGPVEDMGERLVRAVVRTWDADGGATVRVVVPAIMADPGLRNLLQRFLGVEVLGPLVQRLGVADAELRASLAGSQVAGLMMIRYVVGVEPLASASADELATLVGPTLQRYLTGDLGDVTTAR
ncbi:TetR family transcriptional regulator [Isoptericola sediminis]|uniref:TetR/AcrR family transcriptional regulator n=1 Tax=Isoptericola sediminis TaxID=2733572 RepID=A0A849KD79_9MICO|nr:TetR family transcriptional regulator [Isoptericola sediminis]NNU26513.1 TetR/AcrR family transcriptional regulator [Isoptericola sediminis]